MTDEDIGARVVAGLGEPAARELLEVLERCSSGLTIARPVSGMPRK
jgi:hypothetical protein